MNTEEKCTVQGDPAEKQTEYMAEAVREAYAGIRQRDGGPFGCVIVKDGVIVGRGHNRVLRKHDPTCHGEMEAIRDACSRLNTHNLSGCTLYTTAEPCPMCLGGCLWANIQQVYYGCTRLDTADIGFRDDDFYRFLAGETELLTLTECGRSDCLQLFADYTADKDRRNY